MSLQFPVSRFPRFLSTPHAEGFFFLYGVWAKRNRDNRETGKSPSSGASRVGQVVKVNEVSP